MTKVDSHNRFTQPATVCPISLSYYRESPAPAGRDPPGRRQRVNPAYGSYQLPALGIAFTIGTLLAWSMCRLAALTDIGQNQPVAP